MVYKVKIQVTINTVLIIVLAVIFEVIPLMNTLSLVILLATSPIRVILSAGSSHQWDTWFGVSQRCLRPGCSRWADNPSKLTQTNCAWSLAGQVDNTLAKKSGNCSIRTNLVLPRMSWPVSIQGWKIWLISRHPMPSSSSTPANNRQLLSVFASKRRLQQIRWWRVFASYQPLRTNELLTRSHTETDHQRHA